MCLASGEESKPVDKRRRAARQLFVICLLLGVLLFVLGNPDFLDRIRSSLSLGDKEMRQFLRSGAEIQSSADAVDAALLLAGPGSTQVRDTRLLSYREAVDRLSFAQLSGDLAPESLVWVVVFYHPQPQPSPQNPASLVLPGWCDYVIVNAGTGAALGKGPLPGCAW